MVKVCAVFDSKAASFGSLVTVPTVGIAARGFVDACADRRSPMAQYPADFTLYELGDYDPATGSIVMLPQPKPVMTAAAAREVRRAEEAKVQPALPGVEA